MLNTKVGIFPLNTAKKWATPLLLRNSNLSSCLAKPHLHITFGAKLTYSCKATLAFAYFFKVGRFKGSGGIHLNPPLKVATASQTALHFAFRCEHQTACHSLVCSFSQKMSSIFRAPKIYAISFGRKEAKTSVKAILFEFTRK